MNPQWPPKLARAPACADTDISPGVRTANGAVLLLLGCFTRRLRLPLAFKRAVDDGGFTAGLYRYALCPVRVAGRTGGVVQYTCTVKLRGAVQVAGAVQAAAEQARTSSHCFPPACQEYVSCPNPACLHTYAYMQALLGTGALCNGSGPHLPLQVVCSGSLLGAPCPSCRMHAERHEGSKALSRTPHYNILNFCNRDCN